MGPGLFNGLALGGIPVGGGAVPANPLMQSAAVRIKNNEYYLIIPIMMMVMVISILSHSKITCTQQSLD